MFKKGKVYECCTRCATLDKFYGKSDFKIMHFSLNHYRTCNLKCTFCNVYNAPSKDDTDSGLILKCLDSLSESAHLKSDFYVGMGGAEYYTCRTQTY
ncbi:MAG: hypothetical protein Ta2G_12570 [Termitinemataceae bacterium]|nr:MAG: hypothetical protein Ta2G_12570 [Termitinemataceae bacterium]